ncbi:hypothetical protein [Paludisphaera mucosa]|uniref:Uncharacterized protein n=1 Tax=Paludisphaera mucosa TaxID=3030827 RepID=A0ABT6FCP0_9BACT|nr:hypothetical protein [Paludisphaera mucosa]MDG3005358.1 hypothetical protein [Paludisphaera mucosa]
MSLVMAYAKEREASLQFELVEWLSHPPWDEGMAVAVAWIILAAGARWRAEPAWIDRAGRALGGYFLICLVLSLVDSWW